MPKLSTNTNTHLQCDIYSAAKPSNAENINFEKKSNEIKTMHTCRLLQTFIFRLISLLTEDLITQTRNFSS